MFLLKKEEKVDNIVQYYISEGDACMAKLNFEYYESSTDSVYSDGDIEQELLELVRNEAGDWLSDGRWPIVYHLSHLRHNILNWFPFKQDCSILEIGAGCGALTGLFCEIGAKVVAVELTKRRAEINYHRHKHFDNLEIIVSDFQSIPKDWKFDYVIVNGVLEYAAYMINSNDPYQDFLRLSSAHLNPSGRILLAIENRLGIKYFSGAKEDHTGKYFSGINGYIEGEMVKTFTKGELCEVITKSDLYPIKFYYPYPDYKFPAEIFSDLSINSIIPSVSAVPMDMSRVKLFEEFTVYRSLMKSNIMGQFSNSFLVEIAHSPNEAPSDISYIKISANRHEKYRICTYFDANMETVYKQALNPLSIQHIKNMSKYSGYQYGNRSLKNVICHSKDDHAIFPFITDNTLEDSLLDACNDHDIDRFVAHIKKIRDLLYANTQHEKQPISQKFVEIFGDSYCDQSLRWKDQANVDMISGNIFMSNNEFKVIDYEWHIPCSIPLEFVMWRMLKQFVDNHSLHRLITNSIIQRLIGINKSTEECFTEWERHFAHDYVGIKDLHDLSKDIISLDIDNAVLQQLNEKQLQSTLFLDLGDGFSSLNYERISAKYSSEGFCATFSNENLKHAKALRWDPLEGSASNIQIQKIETDGHLISINPINAEKEITEDTGFQFFTFDPQFLIDGDFSNATYLEISFVCTIIDWTQGYRVREEEIADLHKTVEKQSLQEQNNINEINLLKQELKENIEKINFLDMNIETLRNQYNNKTIEFKAASEELSKTKKLLDSTRYELEDNKTYLSMVQENLSTTQGRLNHIMEQFKLHRFKSAIKILLYGNIFRGNSSE